MGRNPPWTRDELILALDLYRRVNPLHTSEQHRDIQSLSALLNRLPGQTAVAEPERFRNPNGVYMKLCNFLRLDPTYAGKGLQRGGKLEEQVWKEFANDPVRLGEVARAIRAAVDLPAQDPAVPPAVDDDDDEFQEGGVLTALHKRRERKPEVARRKKAAVLKATGALECEACGFDFNAVYGALGKGFAECHHRLPLAALPTHRTVRLKDLAVVCANCHRMLHRTRPMMSVEDLAGMLKTRGR